MWRPGFDSPEWQNRSVHDDPGRARSTLILGGTASGKSRYAELLVATQPEVRYVATGRPADGTDPEWDAKVLAHQQRRPPSWSNHEVNEPARLGLVLHESRACLLWDSVGGWLTGVLDRAGAWDDAAGWRADVAETIDTLIEAWRTAPAMRVAVAEEVGWGLLPMTASGRLFQHELGSLNQRLAAASDSVRLVVAGRGLDLTKGLT